MYLQSVGMNPLGNVEILVFVGSDDGILDGVLPPEDGDSVDLPKVESESAGGSQNHVAVLGLNVDLDHFQ